MTSQALGILNKKVGAEFNMPVLCMKNEGVEYWNNIYLQNNGNPVEMVYPEVKPVSMSTKESVKNHPAWAILPIQLGAEIMFFTNDSQTPWRFQNGTRGQIVHIDRNNQTGRIEKVQVCTRVGQIIPITPMEFRLFDVVFDPAHNSLKQNYTGYIEAFPFRLGYASTVHKSQGLTLDYGLIERESGAYQPGQMYTALSRFRDLSSIRLSSLLSAGDFQVDPSLTEYMSAMQFQAVHP